MVARLNDEEREKVANSRINLHLMNVPLSTALKYTTSLAGLSHQPDEVAVVIGGKLLPAPAKPAEAPDRTPAQKFINAKLKNIVMPKMDFEDTTLQEAVEFLRLRSREPDPEPDPDKKGLNILLRLDKKPLEEVSGKKITLKLENVPLSADLSYGTKATDLKYRVSDFAVEIGG